MRIEKTAKEQKGHRKQIHKTNRETTQDERARKKERKSKLKRRKGGKQEKRVENIEETRKVKKD